VSFAGYSRTFSLTSGDRKSGIVTDILVTVPVTTSAYLTFQNNTPGNFGALLDNVLINSTDVTQTSEPPGQLLVGGLCLAALLSFRYVLQNARGIAP
jgi:hypothetical protein